MARFVTGTIAQLVGKVSFNGKPLTSRKAFYKSMSELEGPKFRRVGLVRRANYRGRPAVIWQVDTNKSPFSLTNGDANGLIRHNKSLIKLRAA